MEVVASLSQGRTAAAQCGFFTYKSVPVIFEPPCNIRHLSRGISDSRKGCHLRTNIEEDEKRDLLADSHGILMFC